VCGAAAYFACAQFTAPAWNSLIVDWLDQHERGAYFARRAQVIAGLSFFALCGAGWVLSLWQHSTAAWWGFVLIFALAGSARILSALALSPVQDLHPTAHQEAQQGFRGFFRLSATKDFRRFLLFSGLMHASVLIAGPFFVLYMLQDLQLSYIGYGGWLAAGLLGQLLTLQAWGQFGDRFGNKAILSITGFTVPILPMLYLVSTNLGFLLAVNFLGGVIWAGLALGLQNYVFDSVRPEERAKAIALYSTVNAIGWSVGALLGSWLVESLPVRIEWAGVILQPASNLPFVFFLSGVLRLLVSSSLLGSFHETRQVERVPRQQLLWELPLVKPIARFAVWALPKSNR
jgi:MFS family permease